MSLLIKDVEADALAMMKTIDARFPDASFGNPSVPFQGLLQGRSVNELVSEVLP